MLSAAARAALQMIANERILQDETLLDAIGRPVRLAKSTDPDVGGLHALGESVLACLPGDLAAGFVLIESSEKPMVGLVNEKARTVATFEEYLGPAGERWVAAAVGVAVTSTDADDSHVAAVSKEELVNRLNWSSQGCAWMVRTLDDVALVFRVSGSATPLDSRLSSWRRVVAYLLVDALAAIEGFRDESSEARPARNYLRVLALEHGPDSSAFSQEELLTAGREFRDGLPDELARVVDVQPTKTGVLVSVPFRAGSTTYPLSVAFSPVAPDPESPDDLAGLGFMSHCYTHVPAESALRWARTFNGDDDGPEPENERWDQTTPWLAGSWQSWVGPEPEKMLIYRGFVPNALKPYLNLPDLVAGVVREVWVSCDKYRLRERFNETMGL